MSPGSGEPLLSLRDATVGWGRSAVVSGVSFELRPTDWLGIVGPNGSGKSTLLRAALGLAEPLRGEILRSPAWRAGHVPQRDTLEPLFRFRAREVVEMFARIGAPSAASAREETESALHAVAMDAMADRVFRDLSGGQKQRILIARALAVRPTVLVLDEPTTGMDVRAEAELLAMVRRIRSDRGIGVILVTHSLHLVADESTEVGILQDGRAVFGTPEEVLAPEVLSRIYRCPVHSVAVDGHRMIRAVVGAPKASPVSA